MPATRRILLADPDTEATRMLAPALRGRGFEVHTAVDGSRALELSVLRYPDLILFDEDCRLIDAATFQDILRANPRTEGIPVLVTGRGEPDGRDSYLRKPYNVDELLARVDQVFHRLHTSQTSLAPDKEVQGQLAQMALPDLLQVFAMNRNSGRLVLRTVGETVEVIVVDGKVHDVRGPRVAGQKALFRYLLRRQGTFEFHPGRFAAPDRIGRSLDDVLLEGMRQNDELRRLAEKVPEPGAHLILAVDPNALIEQHPVVAEVLRHVSSSGGLTYAELLDRMSAPDADAAQAVATLLERGYLQVGAEIEAGPPLLDMAEAHALRQRLLRGRTRPPRELCTKVVLAGADAAALDRAARRLSSLAGFTAEHGPQPFGTFGRLQLGDGLRLELIRVPTDDALRPLWRPLVTGALGAVIFDPGDTGAELADWLAREHLPSVVSPLEAPVDPVQAVREVLQAAAAPRS